MNQHDPLAQLRDIHLPDMPTWWPPAPGWWLLAVLFLAALGWSLWTWQRHHQRQAYRRQAVQALEQAWTELTAGGNPNRYAQMLSEILRRTALTAYPDQAVGSLTGTHWLEFLDASSPKAVSGQFLGGNGKQLASLPYRPVDESLDLSAIHHLAITWLQGHVKLKNPYRGEADHAGV